MSVLRVLVCIMVLVLCGLAILRAFAVEVFHIPSGSMAPALLGNHRQCACPRCGQVVAVGRHTDDPMGTGDPRFYRNAFCPTCGNYPLAVHQGAEVQGDQVTVDRTAYVRRPPSRWEIVVFRLLSNLFIKRLIGLPGEVIRIHAGDVYVNNQVCRKTLDEARRMRVLIEDKGPGVGLGNRVVSGILPAALKCEPIRDEYAYNAGLHASSELVHDFMVESEIEILSGRGAVSLRLCDGGDWVETLLPVGETGPIEAFAWPLNNPEHTRKFADSPVRLALHPGRRYRVEMALIDRRCSVAIDGKTLLVVDLPESGKRAGVSRPFVMQLDGVRVRVLRHRLFRDIHYGQQGRNAVQGKSVRLGPDQYFMLGDNSANSEDSRYWSNRGRVGSGDLLGPVLHVQRPGR
ncbi:MAG: hypothetical protein HYX68_20965 [Planctomycetes bacterium]|nr:hypothetical protein [Planctomycetota bacterium]